MAYHATAKDDQSWAVKHQEHERLADFALVQHQLHLIITPPQQCRAALHNDNGTQSSYNSSHNHYDRLRECQSRVPVNGAKTWQINIKECVKKYLGTYRLQVRFLNRNESTQLVDAGSHIANKKPEGTTVWYVLGKGEKPLCCRRRCDSYKQQMSSF